jgi:hypothetical protein
MRRTLSLLGAVGLCLVALGSTRAQASAPKCPLAEELVPGTCNCRVVCTDGRRMSCDFISVGSCGQVLVWTCGSAGNGDMYCA